MVIPVSSVPPSRGPSIPNWGRGVKRPAYLARFPSNTRRSASAVLVIG